MPITMKIELNELNIKYLVAASFVLCFFVSQQIIRTYKQRLNPIKPIITVTKLKDEINKSMKKVVIIIINAYSLNGFERFPKKFMACLKIKKTQKSVNILMKIEYLSLIK